MENVCKLISVVLPVFNEEGNLKELISRLDGVFQGVEYDKEYIFVNDGSQDNSVEIIKEEALSRRYIKLIDFSRNFGKQIALAAGLNYAKGDAVIIMDSDLQHPPSVISELFTKWENGTEIVLTKRFQDKKIPFLKKLFSKVYLCLFSKVSGIPMNEGTSDFCLLDKKVVIQLRKFKETKRLFRGLINWIGFKKDYVEFEVEERFAGETGFSFYALLRLAWHGILGFSMVPLKIAGYLGIFITGISIIVFLWMIISDLFNFVIFTPQGYFIVLITFLNGITLMCLGFIALYIGNIQTEVVGRPLYIVREEVNL